MGKWYDFSVWLINSPKIAGILSAVQITPQKMREKFKIGSPTAKVNVNSF